MWKRITAFIVSLAMILGLIGTAAAADKGLTFPDVVVPTGEKDPGSAISPMKKNDKAPFTGVLLSPRAVATIITQINNVDEQIGIEVEKARSEEKAQCEFKTSELKTTFEADKKILVAYVDAGQRDIVSLREQLAKSETSQANLAFWVGMGFVGGVLITLVTVYAVSHTSK